MAYALKFRLTLLLFLSALLGKAQVIAAIENKPLQREFRGAWVASVYNIDWPSKPGLTTEEQKRELILILDKAKALGLNALIFQVRPSSDALYASPYEPWSPFLTGKSGHAPSPAYDPLEYAVKQAHLRCLELHAWINPYRATTGKDYLLSNGHVVRKHPEWIRNYGSQQFLDPGLPEVKEHVLKVVTDIVKRYDIDGLHIDDYFYPYPKEKNGKKIDFPDQTTYQAYKLKGGLLSKADWRRNNVNQMIQSLHQAIHAEKPWVKFGVSPFGIWRPGVPAGTMAYIDACEDLYADSRLWLQEGWLDYFSPQLYWSRDSPLQPFEPLLSWWALQNMKSRHLWPGLATDRVGAKRRPEEIIAQVMLTRNRLESYGHVHWNFKPLLTDHLGLGDQLKEKVYHEPCLIPASPWMVPAELGLPVMQVESNINLDQWNLSWTVPPESAPIALWIVKKKNQQGVQVELIPRSRRKIVLKDSTLMEVSLTPVDRFGRLGLEKKIFPPSLKPSLKPSLTKK